MTSQKSRRQRTFDGHTEMSWCRHEAVTSRDKADSFGMMDDSPTIHGGGEKKADARTEAGAGVGCGREKTGRQR